MGTISIQAHQPTFQLRFQDAGPAAPAPLRAGAAASAAEPSACPADQICLSGRKPSDEAPKTLNLFDTPEKAAPQQYIERLSTRQSSINVVGPEAVQLQVGTESAAPEILTSSHDPNAIQELQNRFQNNDKLQNLNRPAVSGEQVIRTGAVIQPDEAVQVQIGMASAVDTDKLLAAKGASAQEAIRPGMYAGVAVKSETVSGRLAVDTAYGKPRVEVGTAVAASKACTLGVSYLQSADDQQKTLRLGTEIRATQDTVFGVNLNQSLNQTPQVNGDTAVGLYLNTRF